MKFSEDSESKHRMITAYGDDFISIDQQRFEHPVILTETLPPRQWEVADFAALTVEAIDPLLADAPEIVLIGTGMTQRFLPPRLMHYIMQRGIGCEVMNTPSACRTWNIIVAEGRRVAAGLMLGTC